MEKLDKVIRALECCGEDAAPDNCQSCPYEMELGLGCAGELIKDALAWLKEQNRLISELSDHIPCCDNCEGKTTLGERTDKCVYEIEGFDSVIYCAKRGIANCFGYRKKIDELEQRLKLAKDGRLELARQLQERMPVSAGDVIYEADADHGVVTHTVTETFWVANTTAVAGDGHEWADQWVAGEKFYRSPEDAMRELCGSCGNAEYVHEYEIYMCKCGGDCKWKPKDEELELRTGYCPICDKGVKIRSDSSMGNCPDCGHDVVLHIEGETDG